MAPYFIFKGIDSRDHVILERLPLLTRSERTTSIIEVPNGYPVVYESYAFRPLPITIHVGYKDTSASEMLFIDDWLFGQGDLIFSNDTERYHKAVCNGVLTGSRISSKLGRIPVSFTLLPFKYAVSNDWETINLQNVDDGKQGWISYEGTVWGEPTIKLYGNGEIYCQLGPNPVTIRNVVDHCIIDVPQKRVFDKDGNVILNNTVGNITSFNLVNNVQRYMKVSSNVTKVEVLKNTRWK